MRLSHIIKKKRKGAADAESAIQESAPIPEIKTGVIDGTAIAVEPAQKIKPVQVQEKTFSINKEERARAFDIYAGMINFVKEACDKGNTPGNIYGEAETLCTGLIDGLTNGNSELILLTAKTTRKKPVLSHLANMCIYSVKIGILLNLSREKLIILGVAALLHELELKSKVPGKELMDRKNTPMVIRAIMDKVQNNERFVNLIEEQELDELGSIVAMMDYYERLSHSGIAGEMKLPHEVLKVLIESHPEGYDNLLVRKMIEMLSIYPPGSYVRLDTAEIGQVIRANAKFPTRPVVKILLDQNNNVLPEARYIDLAESPMVHISEPVDDNKLEIKDKKFIIRYKINKWWVL